MPYHIRLILKPVGDLFVFDLTEEVTHSYVNQLLKGAKRIVVAGKVLSVEEVERIKIISTPKPANNYLYGLTQRFFGKDVPLDEKEPEYQSEDPELAEAGFCVARNPVYFVNWTILFSEMADRTNDFTSKTFNDWSMKMK